MFRVYLSCVILVLALVVYNIPESFKNGADAVKERNIYLRLYLAGGEEE